jgi:CheY-like chemotaxis protein
MLRPVQVRPRAFDAPPVRVQIAEDLPRVQQLLRELVQQAGRFEVCGMDDTEAAALSRFRQELPDVLVVDLNLRQGSGLGLINAVRQACVGAIAVRCPMIIVVTNHTLAALEAASIHAGADHFLDKSRQLPQLGTILQQAFYPP